MTIKEKIKGYYGALGYEVRDVPKVDTAVEAKRLDPGGCTEIAVIWAQEETYDAPDPSREGRIIGSLTELQGRYPRGNGTFVCYNLEGFSQEFRKLAKGIGFSIREEALFFDAEFKSNVNRQAQDISSELRQAADEFRSRRVRQPFRIFAATGEETERGPDVVAYLEQALSKTCREPRIRIVVGPAGAGKTIAFSQLFVRVYEKFQDAKKRKQVASRPIPMVPKHINRSRGATFRAVLDTFLSMEIARPVGAEGLAWMMDQGMVTLLCDGLDEILATDSAFFGEFLLDRLTVPGGVAQVTICVRDSLFNTCGALSEFVESANGQVDILRLDHWGREEQVDFSTKRFRGTSRSPDAFVAALDHQPAATELAGNPFFCGLLADSFESGNLVQVDSAAALCGLAVDALIQREYGKGLLGGGSIQPADVLEFIQSAAEENLKSEFSGIPIEGLRNDAQIFVAPGMTSEQADELVNRLVQLPIFARSADPAMVEFAHEILAFYLLAQSMVTSAARRDDFSLRGMDNPALMARGILIRLLSEVLRQQGLGKKMWDFLVRSAGGDAAFRAILQTAIMTDPGGMPPIVKEKFLSQRDLHGIRFRCLDLRGAHFDGSDLTNAEFVECDLRDSTFHGCVIKQTRFDLEKHDMDGVRFGNYHSVHSVFLGTRLHGDPGKAVKALADFVSEPPPRHEPCPTARQLRFLLEKFVRENGQYRRDSMDLKGFLLGKRFDGAADNEDILDTLCSGGYLTRYIRPKPGVARAGGEFLNEITSFVTKLRLSEGLKAVLDECCPEAGCKHIHGE